jgi:hypothetical protein
LKKLDENEGADRVRRAPLRLFPFRRNHADGSLL